MPPGDFKTENALDQERGKRLPTALVPHQTAIILFDDSSSSESSRLYKEIAGKARQAGVAVVHALSASSGASQNQRDDVLRGDFVFASRDPSAFASTGLDALLQDLDVSTLLLLGDSSSKRALATAIDASTRGYQGTLVNGQLSNDSNPTTKGLFQAGLITKSIDAKEILASLTQFASAKRQGASDHLETLLPHLAESFQDNKLWTHKRSIEYLRQEANRIDALGEQAGPLAGLFFSIKENIDVHGWTSTAMQIRPGIEPEPRSSTAPVVERLLDAGAILVGKNSMDLFATGTCGVRCPGGQPLCATDPERVPGGSSSGSAVAVAKNVVDFSLGTDTAGSVRIPAALNGIIGLKPSLSALSIRGVIACQPLLDSVGIFAREISLLRKVWIVARGYDAADVRSNSSSDGPRLTHRLGRSSINRASRPLIIAIPPLEVIDAKCEEPYKAAFRNAVGRMKRSGATIRELTTEEFQPYIRAGELVYGGLVAERYACLAPFLTRKEDWDALIPSTRQFLERASKISIIEYTEALHERLSLQAKMRILWQDKPQHIDALMVPTATDHAVVAEAMASAEDDLRVNARIGYFTYPVNVLDMCGIAVPMSEVSESKSPKRPFGVTFVAPKYDDGFLLSLAERVLGSSA